MAKSKKGARAGEAKPVAVKVSAAKGRPMLTWVGKRPLGHVTAYPAQLIERFRPNPSIEEPAPNLLFHGDNKDVLAWLLANGYRGKVQLVYIDPPFDSGADYVRKVSLRGPKGSMKLDGETYSLGEQIQYTDIWANDNYLQFMYERILLLRELLSDSGVLWLHCDWNRSHQLRMLIEEVFGPESIINEIAWQRISAHPDSTFFGHVHDTLFFCAKNREQVHFTTAYSPYSDEFVARYFTKDDGDGRGTYWTGDITAPGPRAGLDYEYKGHRPPAGRVWFTLREKLEALDREGRVYWPPGGGRPKLKRYLKEYPGVPATSIWNDVRSLAGLGAKAAERLDYPTQKPVALLRRILTTTSRENDLVLDCFIGSGTTAEAAQLLGRRWIGVDVNAGSIQTSVRRLQSILADQFASAKPAAQGELLAVAEPTVHGPLAIDVYRVNDYDLQVQHNEAVALACEYLGVQRNRGDRYFDGTRGKQLVKITPFNHPLSPVDLDTLKQELDGRPDEDRDVLVVCLGIEQAARRWIDDWNALRKGKAGVNRIEVVELRSDPKYGGFLAHQPARATVSIHRKKDTIAVSVDDFISPTIIERLRTQAGVLEPKIDDWRAMVDSVMIDPAFDGQVFNVVLTDVPARKTDFVQARYELPAPKGTTTVAVKITDMLGEEVLVTRTV
jgi:DNA modification methylase